jgi:integrase
MVIYMRGNVNWQVQNIFKTSGINQIGNSKHIAKEKVRKILSDQGVSSTWHEIGKRIGIFSYKTADTYRDIWIHIGKHVKKEYGIKDLEKLEGKHIQSYLESKISEEVASSTFALYASASEKLGMALNGFATQHETGKEYKFSESIKNARKDASGMLEKFKGSRAYINPKAIIKTLTHPPHQLVAKMQLESGARISECSHLTEKDLRGIKNDPVTGEKKGVIYVKGKGGKSGEKYMSPSTYQELKSKIQSSDEGRFIFNRNSYRDSLKNASEKTNQNYNASHGLRWNFAQFRFQEVQGPKGGQSYEKALFQVSEELFHQRADITEHYLK